MLAIIELIPLSESTLLNNSVNCEIASLNLMSWWVIIVGEDFQMSWFSLKVPVSV
jgi:hypothetical protein